MNKENWLIITLGAQFATLSEFLDVWRYEHQDKEGIITRVFAFTTNSGSFESAIEVLKKALKVDSGDQNRPAIDFEVRCENIDPSRISDKQIVIYRLENDHGMMTDIVNMADASRATSFSIGTIMRIADLRKEKPDTRLLFCIAGGRKTMTADLTTAAMLMRSRDDRVFHLFVDPERNNGSSHLKCHVTDEPNQGGDACLVDYAPPRLTEMFTRLRDRSILASSLSIEDFKEIIDPVTAAMAETTAMAFTRVHMIADPEIKNAYIELVASWISSENQERLWGGDI